MPWSLYLALKQLFPTGKIVSFFAAMSVLGVALGVAVLLCVSSVMNGFGKEIRDKLVEVNGHLQISDGGIMEEPYALAEKIAQDGEVSGVAPIARGVVMLQYGNRPSFPGVLGVGEAAGQEVIPLSKYVFMGSLEELDDDSILLSTGLARAIGTTLGEEVDLFTPLMLDHLKRDEVLLPRTLKVAGLFETGWSAVDENTAVVTLRLMQELYGLDKGAHKLAVRLKHADSDMGAAEREAERFNMELLRPPQTAMSWMDGNREFLSIILLEKTVMVFVMLLILVVAAFSIMISLHTSVVRKTREIGLLGALGARSWQSAVVFCWQGFLIGIAGSLLGCVLALVILKFRNEIVGLVMDPVTMAKYYQFLSFPADYVVADFVKIILFAIVAATLAGLLPAWRAARIRPSETLRHE